jgi:uncharacterized cupin superfamily protein
VALARVLQDHHAGPGLEPRQVPAVADALGPPAAGAHDAGFEGEQGNHGSIRAMTKQALPVSEIPTVRGSSYPSHFAARMGDREKRRLGEAFGLTQFGVNLVILGPGGQSALRHWHTREDELIYMLTGELVLITDAGEQVVRAGDVVGFVAGDSDAHHFLNRGDAPAQYLEVGSRFEDDVAHYPDDDLAWIDGPDGPGSVAAHKDGTRY